MSQGGSLRVAMEQVSYGFYKKPMDSKLILGASMALPEGMKHWNGANELIRQINNTRFYAKENMENTVQFEVCQGEIDYFGTYGFSDFSNAEVVHNGTFKTDSLEIEIIEVNGKSFKEAIIMYE